MCSMDHRRYGAVAAVIVGSTSTLVSTSIMERMMKLQGL